MEKLKYDIAIIGGGISAVTFAENIKKTNPNLTVGIFEKSCNNPYSKVLLPHYIKKIIPREKVFIRTKEQLQEKNIDYNTNQMVSSIDVNDKTFLSSNYKVTYSKLVIASGGEANQINGIQGGYYLQTIEDADTLVTKLENTKQKEKTIVIGGGFISFEFFQIFNKYSFKTTNLVQGGLYFPNLAPEKLTLPLKKILEQNLIEIKSINLVTDVNENFVTFDHQTINSAITGIGAGVTRLNNFFGKIEQGVKTNEYLETEHKDVFAIGDIAIVTTNDSTRITGNWNNAIQQGLWLSKYLSDQTKTKYSFNKTTDYTTNFFGNFLSFIGITNQRLVTNKIVLSKDNTFVAECFINKKLVGAVLLNSANLRTLYQEKVNLKAD